MKACTVCKSIKDIDKFYKSSRKRKDGSFGIRSVCKACTNKKTKEWQKNNLEKARNSSLQYFYKNKKKCLQAARERYRNLSVEEKKIILEKKAIYRDANRSKLLQKQKEKYDPVLQAERWKVYYKKHQEREKARKRKYHRSLDENGKQRVRERVKIWKKNNPEKTLAHRAIEKAIKTNKLVKPEQCTFCKKVRRLDAHHEDYENPLLVVWLCRDCHAKKHSKNFVL